MQALANILRQDILGERDEAVEVPFDERADDFMAETFGCGINRKHLAAYERIGVTVRVRQNDVFPRRQLAPMIEAHRPRDEQRLAYCYAAVKERLPGPNTFQQSAIVPQHRMENPQTAPSRKHAFGHHSPDTGDFLAQLRFGERSQA
jgi:hypothetical protein